MGVIMKRVVLLIVGIVSIIFLIFLSCNGNTKKQDFYGTYTFDELIYLTALSSSSLDYANKTMTDTKYTIEANLFKIEGKDFNVEISSPSYVREDVQVDSSPIFDERILKNNRFKYQYDIKDQDGNKTMWRLYVSPECLFVASYRDSAFGSEVIWEIAKLSK
jgi:hypothetical protein